MDRFGPLTAAELRAIFTVDESELDKSLGRLLTSVEVADRFGITDSAVRRAARRGAFPGARKPGRDWLIPSEAVLHWAGQRRAQGVKQGHGARSRYVAGCRCDECRAAHRRYIADYRKRRKD